jgi:hypothetical protein
MKWRPRTSTISNILLSRTPRNMLNISRVNLLALVLAAGFAVVSAQHGEVLVSDICPSHAHSSIRI